MLHLIKILMVLVFLNSLLFGADLRFDIFRQDDGRTAITSALSDQQIRYEVINALGIDPQAGKYQSVTIREFSSYFVVYLFSATSYESFTYKLDRQRDGAYRVIQNYDDSPENPEVCGTCPDETIEIVVSGSFTDANHVSRVYVKKAYDDLTALGKKVKHLPGAEENRTAIINWLSCKNLLLWGRIGHGSTSSISFAGSRQGSLTPADLAKINLTDKFLIINSCYIHNSSFIPSVITTANAYFFCGGNGVTLLMNQSEKMWHGVVMGGVRDGKEFGELVTTGNQSLSSANRYGFTRNPKAPNNQCFYKDVGKLSMTVETPNGSNVYVVSSTVNVEWSTNSSSKVSLYLLKGSAVAKTIIENTDNDGVYEWKIPDDVSEGSDYKIQAKADSLVDVSDSPFTIKKKPSILCANSLLSTTLSSAGASATKKITIENKGEGSLNFTAKVGGTGSIMVNELYIGNTAPDDGFELWNRGADQDMTGWSVKWNDNAQTSGEYKFTSGYIFKKGATILLSDKSGTTFYLGLNLAWKETTEMSISLINAAAKGVDFVRTAGNTDVPPAGTTWDGAGVDLGTEAYIYRMRNEDSNTKADWTKAATGTINALNPGQTNSIYADYWLAVAPEKGTVNAKATTDLTVTFNSTGLKVGVYTDSVFVGHDDPDNTSPVKVPCKLTVETNSSILHVGFSVSSFGIKYQNSTIVYQIPDKSNGTAVSVKLYNLRGKLVKTLVDGVHQSGYYVVSLDANTESELAAGTYICHMKTKGFSKSVNIVTNK